MSESKRTEFVHGMEFQRGIIKLMRDEDRFCIRAVEFLKKEWFAGELKWFFDMIKGHYEHYKVPPSWSTVGAAINAEYGTAAQPYFDELIKIQDTKVDQEYVKKELTGFIRNNIFVVTYQTASNMYNSGSRENAYDFTAKQMEILARVDFSKERETSFGDADSVMAQAARQSYGAIPTGIDLIDEAMGGGLMPQTWTTFLAGSNVGKGMLMPNLAFHAAMRGKKTFITVHEDEEIPTKLRYLSRFSTVPINKLMRPNSLSDEERHQIKVADAALSTHVKMRFMYTTESTIEMVQHAARTLHKQWRFDLFLCDYGQCLSSAKYGKTPNPRLEQEHVHHELKQLCLELNIAGAGGAQVNRMGHAQSRAGGGYLRCTDVGESWGIVKKSSNVITMNRSDTHMKENQIVYLLDKVRQGRCPVAVQCATDYSVANTHVIKRKLIKNPFDNNSLCEEYLNPTTGEWVMGKNTKQIELNMAQEPVINSDDPTPEYLQAEARDAAMGINPNNTVAKAPEAPTVNTLAPVPAGAEPKQGTN